MKKSNVLFLVITLLILVFMNFKMDNEDSKKFSNKTNLKNKSMISLGSFVFHSI